MIGAAALWSLWWVWLAAALLLAILEVVVPGFIFLGFAVGAGATGLLLLLPFEPGLALLLSVFAVMSLLAWLVLRRIFRSRDDQSRIIREDINK